MASTYLTKTQRENLINEYIECEEMVMDGNQFSEQTREELSKLSNTELIKECCDFMPECLA